MMYHVTPLENLDSILQFGLLASPPNQTSDQHSPLGVYLSSDWVELLASGTYPEIFEYESIAILEVDIPMEHEALELDPEYPSHSMIPEYELDFEVRVCSCNIPPKILSVFGTVRIDDLGDINMSHSARKKRIRDCLHRMFPHYRLEGKNYMLPRMDNPEGIFTF